MHLGRLWALLMVPAAAFLLLGLGKRKLKNPRMLRGLLRPMVPAAAFLLALGWPPTCGCCGGLGLVLPAMWRV